MIPVYEIVFSQSLSLSSIVEWETSLAALSFILFTFYAATNMIKLFVIVVLTSSVVLGQHGSFQGSSNGPFCVKGGNYVNLLQLCYKRCAIKFSLRSLTEFCFCLVCDKTLYLFYAWLWKCFCLQCTEARDCCSKACTSQKCIGEGPQVTVTTTVLPPTSTSNTLDNRFDGDGKPCQRSGQYVGLRSHLFICFGSFANLFVLI